MDELTTELEPLTILLGIPLNTDNGFILADQLTQVEAWGARIAYLHRQAEETLAVLKQRVKPMKDAKNFPNDLDRQLFIASGVAPEQRIADYLGDLQERIDKRISLGQTLLKNHITEKNSGLRID